jgi:hypothetical protein
MAIYEHTKTTKRYRKGERVRTVDGSIHDKRLAASKDWRPADADTEPAADHPAKNAPKADWVDHAVDAGWDHDAADAKTKDELIVLFAGGES